MTRVQAPVDRYGPTPATPEERRARLLAAMADEVGERGYVLTSVKHVIARAGMSRKSFYELFENKEDCFLQAYDDALERIRALFHRGCDGDGPLVERVERGLAAFLDCCAAEPGFARMSVVEPLAAGPAARDRRDAAIHAAARLLAPDGTVPGLLPEAVAGGIYGILYSRIARGEAAQLPALLDELMNAGLRQLAGESVP
jgi:AcrR family transcriptional regulator